MVLLCLLSSDVNFSLSQIRNTDQLNVFIQIFSFQFCVTAFRFPEVFWFSYIWHKLSHHLLDFLNICVMKGFYLCDIRSGCLHKKKFFPPGRSLWCSHQQPGESALCCDSVDFCNKELNPVLTTLSPSIFGSGKIWLLTLRPRSTLLQKYSNISRT